MSLRIWVILCLWAGLVGCSNTTGSSNVESVAWIRIQDSKHKTPSAYMVSVGDQKVYCGSDDTLTSKDIRCSAEGISLSFHPESTVHILVKVAKEKFYEDTVSFGNRDSLHIQIDTLPTFIHTPDQVTGFTDKDGIDLFLTMAYHSTSELGDCYSLKFIITNLDSQPVVHFQNTNKYKLHYAFAKQVLGDTRSVAKFGSIRPPQFGTSGHLDSV